jgi:hypothetical protein
MASANGLFFKFAGFHSFLIGLLPFYIPILLWKQGYALWQLSFFIALTGLGFLLALPLWKILYGNDQWFKIISTSLVLEALLFSVVLFISALPLVASLFLVALLNGAYLCFYWTSQRTLFTQLDNGAGTGNNFGNFQIVVMVLLKVGILLSAVLLEQGYEAILFSLSLAITVFAILSLKADSYFSVKPAVNAELGIRKNSKRSDVLLDKPTRVVFYLDGLFLYLESYFWLLSLYLIAQQDIMQLGLLVVALTLLLAVIFWLLKGRIDGFPVNTIFMVAIVGYAASWLLRGMLGSDSYFSSSFSSLLSSEINYPIILLIAFLTSFFRLSFNKRFFDHVKANQTSMIQYLLDKSALSQLGVLIFFSVLGCIMLALSMTNLPNSVNSQISWIYMTAAPLALIYGFYFQPLEITQGRPSCTR